MILLIENYDSFSYNLYQLIGQVNRDIEVYRNDKITADEIKDLNPEAIILSPGPGRPEDAGICVDVVRKFYDKIPFWEFVLDIRQYVMHLEVKYLMPAN